jgi:hypothetical protein
VSAVVRGTFRRVTPVPAGTAAGTRPGVACERFAGDWKALPDFDALEPERSGVVPAIGLAPGRDGERLGLRFRGTFEVPRDDVYAFALASDDGSDLWIDGQRVVDNDGLHGRVEQRGVMALAAGAHALELRWFNKTGGAELSLSCGALGEPPAPLTGLRAP